MYLSGGDLLIVQTIWERERVPNWDARTLEKSQCVWGVDQEPSLCTTLGVIKPWPQWWDAHNPQIGYLSSIHYTGWCLEDHYHFRVCGGACVGSECVRCWLSIHWLLVLLTYQLVCYTIVLCLFFQEWWWHRQGWYQEAGLFWILNRPRICRE